MAPTAVLSVGGRSFRQLVGEPSASAVEPHPRRSGTAAEHLAGLCRRQPIPRHEAQDLLVGGAESGQRVVHPLHAVSLGWFGGGGRPPRGGGPPPQPPGPPATPALLSPDNSG